MRALIVSHGQLGAGLIDAAQQILGPQSNLFSIDNTGKSPEAMVGEIKKHLDKQTPTMLMIDFAGGSCHAAALKACREVDLHAVLGPVTGVNLPMLLTFLTRHEREKPEELLDMIVDRGKIGIRA